MAQKEKQGRPNDSQAHEFQQDIYAQPKPNLNYGSTGQASGAASTLNAYEIKELHSQLRRNAANFCVTSWNSVE